VQACEGDERAKQVWPENEQPNIVTQPAAAPQVAYCRSGVSPLFFVEFAASLKAAGSLLADAICRHAARAEL
jgi:hypothetical protein